MILGRQLAGGVEANLVEHPAEMHDAAHLVIATPESGNIHAGTVADFRRRATITICTAMANNSAHAQK